MASPFRQTNFSRGELAPLLWGRSDLSELYQSGLRRCRDFFITRHGALMSRPGSTFVHATATNAAVRLVPFVYSDTLSYVLEFGDSVIHFHSAGATVETSPGVPYAVATAYTIDDLPKLRWVQSGNVLTITCPGHPPRELTRVASTAWTLADIDFTRPAPGCTATLKSPVSVGDALHPPREWKYAVTELRRDDRGIVTESAPLLLTADNLGTPIPDTFAVYSDVNQVVQITPSGSLTDPHFIAFLIYRGRAGLFGLVGQTDTVTFTDVGAEPDYTKAPPQGRNPFKVYDDTGALVRTESPVAVAYFEERLVFSGTAERPAFIFLSATGDYANFDERLLPVADEALMYELACRRREEVKHVLGLQQLLVFTSASAWVFGGSGGEPLAPDTLPSAKVQVEVGCTDVPPLSIDGAALFVRNKGVGVRALAYERDRDSFVPVDVSTIAQHFFSAEGLTQAPYGPGAGAQSAAAVVDWAYAEDPFGVVWAVRADGKLLSLTYIPEERVWGWALHETDGEVMAVCSVPEGDEDAVYVATRREIYGSSAYFAIERLTSRIRRGTTSDDICLDCAFEYSGVPVTTLTGLAAFAGRTDVYVIGKDNPPQGPFEVSLSGKLELPELPTANDGTDVTLWVGLLYQPEVETLDAAPSARGTQKSVTHLLFEVDQSKGLYTGADFDHLHEWRQRTVAAGYGVPSSATEVVKVAVSGKWDDGARAVLRQTLPLPVTIVGLTRLVDGGG